MSVVDSPFLACVFLVAFLALGLGAGPVHAVPTYEFQASPRAFMPGFSLLYIDADGDARFSLDELVGGSFSGLVFDQNWYYLQILGVPLYDSTKSPLTDGGEGWSPLDWIFLEYPTGDADPFDPNHWTYSQGVVPLPPSVFMLGAGLIGLAAARRKKRLGP